MSAHSNTRYFLYLKIDDPKIIKFIGDLIKPISVTTEDWLHITLRGPLKEPPDIDDIKRWNKIIEGNELYIQGVGRFNNPDEEVVYLKVNMSNLDRIYYKKDFPKKKYGFHPHISIYRGHDKKRADEIEEFLKMQNIKLSCQSDGYSLTEYPLRQHDMVS